MPRKLIKRFLPNEETLKNHKSLRLFGALILAPNLWHLNKRSVSGAASVGLFCAFIPLPMQMLIAAASALVFRVNLPLSVALVWITNPITIPPMFYSTYLVGCWLLGLPAGDIKFELSGEMLNELGKVWEPLLLGSLLVGSLAAVLANLFARGMWRLLVVKNWQRRRQLRKSRES